MDYTTYYSPSQVTQITGIEAHTLRVWERRYNFMVADRKSSGARIYSEQDLKQLLRVKILLSAGFRISKVTRMSEDEMYSETQKIFASSDPDDDAFIQALMESTIDFNEVLFNQVFDSLLETRGLTETFKTIIYPFLRRVGGLWANNKIIPINEHFISNLIRQKLINNIDQLEGKLDSKKKVMLFLPESEEHEIALLLAYYIFKEAGWQVIYLGQRVPIGDLSNPIQKLKCNYGFTYIQLPRKEYQDQLINFLEKNQKITLFIAGSKALLEDIISHKQCRFLALPEELSTEVYNLK